jgi:hypothetical protein
MTANDSEFESPTYPHSVEVSRQSFLNAIARYNPDVLGSLRAMPYQAYCRSDFGSLLKEDLLKQRASHVFPAYELLTRRARKASRTTELREAVFEWARKWNLLYANHKGYAYWIIEQTLWTMNVWAADERHLTYRELRLRPSSDQASPSEWPYYLLEVWPAAVRFPAFQFEIPGWNPTNQPRATYNTRARQQFKAELVAYLDAISAQARKSGLVRTPHTRKRETRFDRRIVLLVFYQISGLSRELLARTDKVSVDAVRKSLTSVAKLLDLKLRNPRN